MMTMSANSELTPTNITSTYDFGTPLDQSALPSLTELPLTPIEPSYAKMVLLVTSLFVSLALVGIAAILFLAKPATLPIHLVVMTCCIMIGVGLCYFSYKQAKVIRYGVYPHQFILQKGLIWRSTTALPYTRLQHVNLSQGPVERHYQLSSLKCFSAGSGEAEIDLPGLNTDTAESLRQHLLEQAAQMQQMPSQVTCSEDDSVL